MKDLSTVIDTNLINKYNSYAYIYAEYPHKSFWPKEFGAEDFKSALKSLSSYEKDTPLLLYVHSPFCSKLCWYCSCYKVATEDYERVKKHFSFLLREISLFREFRDKNSLTFDFRQIHLGGGSPTYLEEKEFDQLIEGIQSIADIERLDEFAIEIDPRHIKDEGRMKYYREKGINRISFGIQDFDPDVQKAVNRVQPVELIEKLLVPGIRERFDSVNFDILYGLPRQTRESFRKTIDTVIRLSPDRIVLICFNYSPHLHKHQKLLKEHELPDAVQKTMFFLEAVQTLLDNGYVRIGLEYFAKPSDNLAKAWKSKAINWNMIGYTPGAGGKIIGIGPSSESRVTADYYFQNISSLPDYEAAVTQGKFPIYRGCKLNNDDLIRRDVINRLRSYFFLDFRSIEEKYGIRFKEYFKKEDAGLRSLAVDGLLELSDNTIVVTEQGRQFVSFVCMVFDKYLQEAK